MNAWLSAHPNAAIDTTTTDPKTTDPVGAQMLKQLTAAIARLEKATTSVEATADKLAVATRPQKSRLRRAVEIGAGLLLADGVLTFLAGTVPLAGTALTVLQDAFTLTLGLGPVSALVDGLLFAGYTVSRIQKTGTVPAWLTAGQHLVEAVQRLCDRLLPDHHQTSPPVVDPAPVPPDPNAPSVTASDPPGVRTLPALRHLDSRRRAPRMHMDRDALQL